MRLDIISAVPELLDSFFQNSIVKRAQDKGHVEVHIHNLHDYGIGKYKQIDDYPFGGGAGMVLMIEPIAQLIRQLQAERTYDEIIYTAPDGERFNQKTANTLSMAENLIILCGHYKGIDERLREIFVTKEISIGDYVLSGGELAASVISDAIIRLLPGVLGDETSALTDSFQDNLLAPPVYTRPSEWEGHKVPDILLSGHDAKIQDWRHEQAVERTQQRRPDLLS
ncbi:tRNA (guanosine(37)-N1)-methyltransferase TrmD [Siphonobacter sp. BAB-5385]|uniref:tRNA (guanosine(37)-N1)-methyltransferase TrmD n=1 Tax=unclassified Siphonobacter TaxID=2635712 RepID=UPI000B9DFC10|nr:MULTISPECIES: tRNA (guanosine(37)-N1)-methyltransferase TrmD [unclassified Siphonobacter]OZI07230.1 tRNA (guanosine(37)-N1)-methyltransferase TrmD [Siphonobacter sp. BAB-5385]PMD95604.1 tRNA (guanosine(37)-N1)-methyltransferase TrmD [Siphonobacter sp. BAB-5405]